MKTVIVATTIALLVASAPAGAGDADLRCTHEKGALLFNGKEIAVQRTGRSVVVRPFAGTGRTSPDEWTYEVIAESADVGAVRSVRMLPGVRNTAMNVLLGGELIVHRDGTTRRATATAMNVAAGTVESESFLCR